MHNPSRVGAVGLGVMSDGLSPILPSGTVTTRRPIARGGDGNEAGRDQLTREAAPGRMPGDATITMAVNALTIVQGTVQLEVPLLEEKKGEYATARRLVADFRPGRMPSQVPAHCDPSPASPVTYNRHPLSRMHTGWLLLSTKLRVIVDTSLSDFN